MCPSTTDASWEKHYKQLKRYFKKQGHSRVPTSQQTDLSQWVQQQRIDRRNGELSEERIAQLDQLEFFWGKQKKKKKDNFDEMHQQLQAFVESKGHTRAPLTSNLGVWCQKQRTKLRDNTISADHRARLEEIGFDHELKNGGSNTGKPGWDRQCELLASFYQESGHFVLPKRHALYNWVSSQRKAHRDGRLKKDRREKLDALGFCWTEALAVENQKAWDREYEKLKRFQQRKGHSFVQRNDDIQLWRWTEKNDWNQRRGVLPRKRYERLALVKFWDPPPENLSERGETTNQDEEDAAFVKGHSDDGEGNNKNNSSDDESEEEEAQAEENSEEDYSEVEEDDSSDDDDDDDDDDDMPTRTKTIPSRSNKKSAATAARKPLKREKEQEDSKPSARKRLRRCSTFDEEGFKTLYQVGTKVMKYFDEHGWFEGEIISIYEQNVYKIRYEDEDEETYLVPNEQADLDKIVTNADILRHKVGTRIKKHFDGHGWYEGKVVSQERDRYKVRYDDGDKEEYVFANDLEELDEIVANARSQ